MTTWVDLRNKVTLFGKWVPAVQVSQYVPLCSVALRPAKHVWMWGRQGHSTGHWAVGLCSLLLSSKASGRGNGVEEWGCRGDGQQWLYRWCVAWGGIDSTCCHSGVMWSLFLCSVVVCWFLMSLAAQEMKEMSTAFCRSEGKPLHTSKCHTSILKGCSQDCLSSSHVLK